MTDQERGMREAIEALATRLAARDQGDDERADPEPFAQEYVTWLRLRGWRWRPPAGHATAPGPRPGRGDPARHAELLAAARADCAKASAKLSAGENGDMPSSPAAGTHRSPERNVCPSPHVERIPDP